MPLRAKILHPENIPFAGLRPRALVLALAVVLLSSPLANGELLGIGDISEPIEPLGYGIFGQPPATGDLIVGVSDVGGVFIDVAFGPGPLISPSGTVGDQIGSYGSMSLDGYPSDWLIGDTGTAADSAVDLIVGNEGTGTIDLFDSAKIQVGDNAFDPNTFPTTSPITDIVAGDGVAVFGYEVSGYGQLTMTNVASRFVTADLIVGDLGVGDIVVQSRAALYSADSTLGNQGGSQGTVTLTDLGTIWNVGDTDTTATLDIGNGTGGKGVLNINSNALVQTTGVVTVSETGQINLDGGRLRDIEGSTIANDGVIRGDGVIQAAINIGPVGELRNAAATANEREYLQVTETVDNQGTIESLGGEMEFLSTVVNDMEIIARDAVMRFPKDSPNGIENNGVLVVGGDTTIHGNITGTGSIELLPSSEALMVGDLVLSSGVPSFSAAIGSSASALTVTGDVTLGGFLALDYYGTSAGANESYDILFASGSISGSFLNTQVVADGQLWDIMVSGSTVTVENSGVMAAPMGTDFNGDGIVDAQDLAIWEMYYGTTGASQPMGDADGDGDVDGADFLKIQIDLGGPPSPLVSAVTTVPEPSTFLMSLAILTFRFRRRD